MLEEFEQIIQPGSDQSDIPRSASVKQQQGSKVTDKSPKLRTSSVKEEKGSKVHEKADKSPKVRSPSVKQEKKSTINDKEKSPKSGRAEHEEELAHNESGKKKKKRPLSFLKKKK